MLKLTGGCDRDSNTKMLIRMQRKIKRESEGLSTVFDERKRKRMV